MIGSTFVRLRSTACRAAASLFIATHMSATIASPSQADGPEVAGRQTLGQHIGETYVADLKDVEGRHEEVRQARRGTVPEP